MIAASKGDLKVVECLVRAGADISVEDGVSKILLPWKRKQIMYDFCFC